MTLILTRASKDFVLQVTDRLVTQGMSEFDSLANKNIVYCARNAIVAIAYTGFAFLGDIPTDQWVVEQLIGQPFDRDRKPPAVVMGLRPQSLDLGRSLTLLKEKLDAAAATSVPEKWKREWHANS